MASAAKKTSTTTPAKKATVTKPATKKTAAKKTAAKKSPAKKAATKKAATKKAATKKAATKKAATKETAAKKTAAKKSPATKAATKKTATKKAATKETAAKKTAAKKSPATKAATKKTATKKSPATKAATKKATTKRAASTGRTDRAVASSLVVLEQEDPWTAAELAEVREQLHADVERLTGELAEVEGDLAGMIENPGEGAGHDQADVGSSSYERDQERQIVNNARDMLVQSRHALERIDDGSYGQCEVCGEPIGKNRLMAFPRATLCLRCKQREERR